MLLRAFGTLAELIALVSRMKEGVRLRLAAAPTLWRLSDGLGAFAAAAVGEGPRVMFAVTATGWNMGGAIGFASCESHQTNHNVKT